MSDLMDVIDIPADHLVLTHWNCNEMGDAEFAALVDEMEVGGFDEPLHVVPIASGEDKGKHLVLGGEHRYKAAISLGYDAIPCVVKDHLSDADEANLMLWSNKRNHVRGKVNKEKYIKMEQVICSRMDLQRDVARKRMLMREDRAKKAKKSKDGKSSGSGGAKGRGPDTDGERETRRTMADRQRLLADAKSFQQECLVDSGDTVEHGYFYIGQNGKTHLIVDESKQLHGLVAAVVRVCKQDSARVDEFLVSAIKNELKNWD